MSRRAFTGIGFLVMSFGVTFALFINSRAAYVAGMIFFLGGVVLMDRAVTAPGQPWMYDGREYRAVLASHVSDRDGMAFEVTDVGPRPARPTALEVEIDITPQASQVSGARQFPPGAHRAAHTGGPQAP